MGRFKKIGSVGQIQGKVGDVVCATWKGIPYVRSLPQKRKSSLTEKEVANRLKWSMAHAWLKPVTKFVREGFKNYTSTVEGFIAAKSYILKNAFEGEAPDYSINPALMKVSIGNLPLPEQITATLIDDFVIQFTWSTENIAISNRYDQVMLLAYDIDHQEASHKLLGQFRTAGADTLQLRLFEDRVYQLYIAFVAADRSAQSDSVYLGAISV